MLRQLCFLNTSTYIHSGVCICSLSRQRPHSGEPSKFCLLSRGVYSAGKWTYFFFFVLFPPRPLSMDTNPWVHLACLLLVSTLFAVHITLVHLSLTLNVDVRIISCTHVKKSSVFQKKLKDCTMFKVPGVIQTVLTFMVLLMKP